jgi:hypothetical protein
MAVRNSYISVELDPTLPEMLIVLLLNEIVCLVARLLEALNDDCNKNVQKE